MSEPLGFDISSLGDVESPELVRGALRRFRRRVVRAVLAVLIVGLLAAGTVAAIRRDPFDVSRQVESAAASVEPGSVYRSGDVTLILAKVADLGSGTGLHMLLVYPNLADTHEILGRIDAAPGPGMAIDGEGPIYDLWVAGPLPGSGAFDVVVEATPKCTDFERAGGGLQTCTRFSTGTRPTEIRFHIDLNTLNVPETYWKKGGSS